MAEAVVADGLLKERAAAAALEPELLVAEIAVLRLRIRGILAYLTRPDLTMAERLAAYRIVLRAVRSVGRLMQAQVTLRKEKGLDASGCRRK